jgi:exopolyphosphatase/guanosine-5'-triphosphate,3'-diphosphate pyrophosphatase
LQLFLIRHARGVPRSHWLQPPDLSDDRRADSDAAPGHDDRWRPLSQRGREQARALVRELAPRRPARILSGPARRCRETVQPLAEQLGLPIEVDPRLDEAVDEDERIAVLETLGETPTVVCTHAPAIACVLDVLEVQHDGETPAASATRKGSYWQLFGPGLGPLRARYIEPRLDRDDRGPDPPAARRAAVLDLGSTSFHLLVAEWSAEEGLREVASSKSMLRLGAAVVGGGAIPQRTVKRALTALRRLREVAEREKAEFLWPVATAALREAPNGARVAQEISSALDTPVRILSGQEEARVIFRAFQQRLDLDDQPLIGLDLGGGSLELASGHGRHVQSEVTLPLGAVRLRHELGDSDPMSSEDIAAVRSRVRRLLEPHREALLRPGGAGRPRAVAAGGTVRALASLLGARDGCASNLKADVSVDVIDSLALHLARSTHDERLAMKGMRRRRADILPIGSLVITEAARVLGLTELTLCDWGLREGILLESLAGRPVGG